VGKLWALEDHLCRRCGGRILRCVSGGGATGGGNPIFRCADCGISTSAMGPEALCWCDFAHRRQQPGAYVCVPYSILREHPGALKYFRRCGCDPEAGGEVGIMLAAELREAMAQPPAPGPGKEGE